MAEQKVTTRLLRGRHSHLELPSNRLDWQQPEILRLEQLCYVWWWWEDVVGMFIQFSTDYPEEDAVPRTQCGSFSFLSFHKKRSLGEMGSYSLVCAIFLDGYHVWLIASSQDQLSSSSPRTNQPKGAETNLSFIFLLICISDLLGVSQHQTRVELMDSGPCPAADSAKYYIPADTIHSGMFEHGEENP
jgi:hypothetical protein